MKSNVRCSAFSLVETNLAILLVGIGLLALFALFPMGLQQSDLAVTDTQEAMFAEYVLSVFEGNAAAIADWDDWTSTPMLRGMLLNGITNITLNIEKPYLVADDDELEFPSGSGRYLTYKLAISTNSKPKGMVISATLKVVSGRNQDITTGQDYYSEAMFMGE